MDQAVIVRLIFTIVDFSNFTMCHCEEREKSDGSETIDQMGHRYGAP